MISCPLPPVLKGIPPKKFLYSRASSALWWPGWVGWVGGWGGDSRGRGYVSTHSWFHAVAQQRPIQCFVWKSGNLSFSFSVVNKSNCYFKSPNISGMLAPCAWKERVGLDDPFLIFILCLPSWLQICAERLREEKEAPGLSRSFNSTVLAWW